MLRLFFDLNQIICLQNNHLINGQKKVLIKMNITFKKEFIFNIYCSGAILVSAILGLQIWNLTSLFDYFFLLPHGICFFHLEFLSRNSTSF